MVPLTPDAPAHIRIGVSSCLLGAAVRYDGQHKRNDFLVDELGPAGRVGSRLSRGRGRHGRAA